MCFRSREAPNCAPRPSDGILSAMQRRRPGAHAHPRRSKHSFVNKNALDSGGQSVWVEPVERPPTLQTRRWGSARESGRLSALIVSRFVALMLGIVLWVALACLGVLACLYVFLPLIQRLLKGS